MVEVIIGSLLCGSIAGAVGFQVGWRTGRRDLRRKKTEPTVTECFLKLLNY